MAGVIEIAIKKEVILSKTTKLDEIARSVSQKKITSSVNHSKGQTSESLNNLIQELNNMGTALGNLMNENVKNVRLIADEFSAKDSAIASKLKGVRK